jgi:hypothetical protein
MGMTKDEVLRLLEAEEEKRRERVRATEEKLRREYNRRKDEIATLVAEQNADFHGKLWGEFSMEGKADDTDRDRSDVIGRLCPFRHTPEDIVIEAETMQIAEAKITEVLGGGPYLKYYRQVLGGCDFEELCAESGSTRGQMVEILSRILTVVAPERAERARAERREELTASAVWLNDGIGRVELSEAAKNMSLDELHQLLLASGFQIARITVWKARKKGWFTPGYHTKNNGQGTLRRCRFVVLTPEETQMGVAELMRTMGLSEHLARTARKRGWFQVMKNNQELIRVPSSRIEEGFPPLSAEK